METEVRDLQERLEDENEFFNVLPNRSNLDNFTLEQLYLVSEKYEFGISGSDTDTDPYDESVDKSIDNITFFPKHEKIIVLKMNKSISSYHLEEKRVEKFPFKTNCIEKWNEDSLLCVVDNTTIFEIDIKTDSVKSKIETKISLLIQDQVHDGVVILKKLSDDKCIFIGSANYQIVSIEKRSVQNSQSIPRKLNDELMKGYSQDTSNNLVIDSSTIFHVTKSFRPWLFLNFFIENGEVALLFDYLERRFLKLYQLNDVTIVYYLTSYMDHDKKEEFLVSAGICSDLIVHNVRTGLLVRKIKGPSAVWSGDIFDGRILVTGSSTGYLHCLFLPEGDSLQKVRKLNEDELQGRRYGIFDVALCRGKGTKELYIAYTDSIKVKVLSVFGIEFSTFMDDEAKRDQKERYQYLNDEENLKDTNCDSILVNTFTIQLLEGNIGVFAKFLLFQ